MQLLRMVDFREIETPEFESATEGEDKNSSFLRVGSVGETRLRLRFRELIESERVEA